jgi:hypothetical protein
MATDRRGGQFGRGFEGREVVGSFAETFPHAGSGVAVKAIALYADDSMDETMPIASLQGISDLEDLGDTLLMARPRLGVDALVMRMRFLRLAEPLDSGQ